MGGRFERDSETLGFSLLGRQRSCRNPEFAPYQLELLKSKSGRLTTGGTVFRRVPVLHCAVVR